MTIYPDLPYDAAGGHGASRVSTQMVVIHATGQTASDEAEAHYAEHRSDHTSAHFYSDDDSVIQALDTGLIAYGCFPIGNSRSIQFEITGVSDHISDAALRRVAPIVARVCEQYGIPIRHVGPAELRRGTKGISGHADVTAAWRQGDHTDPGPDFPWSTFIGYIQAAATPATTEEDNMGASFPPFTIRPAGATSLTIPPVEGGVADPRPCWLSFCNDTAGQDYALRVYVTNGTGSYAPLFGDDGVVVCRSGVNVGKALPAGVRGITIQRVPAPGGGVYADDLTGVIERGPVLGSR